MKPCIHRFNNSASLVADLVQRISVLAADCLADVGSFHIVLAGGSTPRQLYQQLRHINTDWSAWHIYFGDERCLPVGDVERNDTMATSSWLSHVAIPEKQIYPVPAIEDAQAAAAAYASLLDQAPRFDLVLLGLGEDGHTASLFPEHTEAATNKASAVAILDAPKPPAQRVSMSPQRLSHANAVWFVITGENKRRALEAWLTGTDLPPRQIMPRLGVDIFTDLKESQKAAAAQ
jgi:6-phosphogluconolactonase